jgi:mono/diheme cytochrome c family protein
MRVLKFGAIALGVFLVAQAFRIDKTNPPVTADVDAPAPVKEVMKRACYACHSNETAWPWYSDVAPVSWLVAYDVHEGRAELNFSQWGTYQPAQRLKKLKNIGEEVAEGEMPPWYYIYPMHVAARLSTADREAITTWVASESAASKQTEHSSSRLQQSRN